MKFEFKFYTLLPVRVFADTAEQILPVLATILSQTYLSLHSLIVLTVKAFRYPTKFHLNN